jgi:hypothetical protein
MPGSEGGLEKDGGDAGQGWEMFQTILHMWINK